MKSTKYRSFINISAYGNWIALSVVLLIILTAFNSNGKDRFELNGKAVGLDGAKLVLIGIHSHGAADTLGQDVVRNGSFHFTGRLGSPVFAQLISSSPQNYSYFWLVPGTVEVDLDTARVSENSSKELIPMVKGSREQDIYNIYLEKMKFLSSDLARESKTLANVKDPEEKKKIEEKISELREEYFKKSNSMILSFAKENNSSVVAAYLMRTVMNDQYHSVDSLQSVMDNFTEDVKRSQYYKNNKEELEILKRIQPGEPAPDFRLLDPQGKEFSLSSLKGKVVLIDFWASWCLPCIASIPSLKKLYEEYKAKGFEILGVSNDTKKDAWLKSMKLNSIPWKNVVDRFPKPPARLGPAEAATLYGIHYLPTTILVNKNGMIVAKNLHGEELKAKIKKILE